MPMTLTAAETEIRCSGMRDSKEKQMHAKQSDSYRNFGTLH